VRTLDIDAEVEQDAFLRAKQNIKISQEVANGTLKTNVYRGENGYANYVKLSEDDLRSQRVRGTLGPIKAPSNVRSSVRVDYQKYLCKDFNEKGYCGYGDNCIYLHDRYDYKPGWQIDQEYDKAIKNQQLKKQGIKVDEDSDYEIHESDQEKDQKCGICDQDPMKPVMTECQHRFCESCALKHYGKTGKCYICHQETHGIFNKIEEVTRIYI
jgi:RING finger protein 113A